MAELRKYIIMKSIYLARVAMQLGSVSVCHTASRCRDIT